MSCQRPDTPELRIAIAPSQAQLPPHTTPSRKIPWPGAPTCEKPVVPAAPQHLIHRVLDLSSSRQHRDRKAINPHTRPAVDTAARRATNTEQAILYFTRNLPLRYGPEVTLVAAHTAPMTSLLTFGPATTSAQGMIRTVVVRQPYIPIHHATAVQM